MDDFREWLRRHVWIIGTGVTAALVFLLTFVSVSAFTGVDKADSGVARAPLLPGTSEAFAADSPAVSTPPPAEPDPAQEAEEAAAPVTHLPLPDFDEDTLIYGGSGEQGSILAGPGIVPSTGLGHTTPWILILPSARIRASIVNVGLTPSRIFGAPDNPDVIGLWEDGPAPGERGNVLLDGHRDYSDIDDNVGTGVCWLLPETVAGDFILIRDLDREVHYLYAVTEAMSLAVDDPLGVTYLQSTNEAILTLITCEGSFDEATYSYGNRRIVVAELLDTIPFEMESPGPAEATFPTNTSVPAEADAQKEN